MHPPHAEGPMIVNFNVGHMHKTCYHVFWNYKVGRPKNKEAPMLSLTCTNEEKILVNLNPVTPGGNSIGIEGLVVTVQSGDGGFAMVDGNSFWVESGVAVGDTVYVVTADADLGAGVVNVSDFITLRVEGAMAASLGLGAGAPVLK
jgi:hypothetical protein